MSKRSQERVSQSVGITCVDIGRSKVDWITRYRRGTGAYRCSQLISEDFRGKNVFERAELTKDAEITTTKKFMIPFDVIALTPDEFENETSPVAEYAKKGTLMYGV